MVGIDWRAVGTYAPEIKNGVVLQSGCVDGVQAVEERFESFAKGVIRPVLRDLKSRSSVVYWQSSKEHE
jgi:hypothetical protein